MLVSELWGDYKLTKAITVIGRDLKKCDVVLQRSLFPSSFQSPYTQSYML